MTEKTQAAAPPADWNPAKVREEDGVHLAGASELPANHRLRAEALVALGKKTDPDGMIGDELIADTSKRLKAETRASQDEKAAAAAKPEGTDQ
jgi:hypothetical protein